MRWVDARELTPERGGMYAVIRSSAGGRIFPDVCRFTPAINGGEAYWSGARGPIRSVRQWFDAGEEAEHDGDGEAAADPG